jgi:hypothetical protein
MLVLHSIGTAIIMWQCCQNETKPLASASSVLENRRSLKHCSGRDPQSSRNGRNVPAQRSVGISAGEDARSQWAAGSSPSGRANFSPLPAGRDQRSTGSMISFGYANLCQLAWRTTATEEAATTESYLSVPVWWQTAWCTSTTIDSVAVGWYAISSRAAGSTTKTRRSPFPRSKMTRRTTSIHHGAMRRQVRGTGRRISGCELRLRSSAGAPARWKLPTRGPVTGSRSDPTDSVGPRFQSINSPSAARPQPLPGA